MGGGGVVGQSIKGFYAVKLLFVILGELFCQSVSIFIFVSPRSHVISSIYHYYKITRMLLK